MSDQSIPVTIVLDARNAVMAIRGSSRKNRSTGMNCCKGYAAKKKRTRKNRKLTI